eukprot:1684106-Prymnesium_polylepis.2
MPHHAILANVVSKLVVDDTSRVRHRTPLEGGGGCRCEDLLQPVVHDRAITRGHPVSRVPGRFSRDHRLDDCMGSLLLQPGSICARRRGQTQLVHPLSAQLSFPPPPVLQQRRIEPGTRRWLDRSSSQRLLEGVAGVRSRISSKPVCVPVHRRRVQGAGWLHLSTSALDLLVAIPHVLLPISFHICHRHDCRGPVPVLRAVYIQHREVEDGCGDDAANHAFRGGAGVIRLVRLVNRIVVPVDGNGVNLSHPAATIPVVPGYYVALVVNRGVVSRTARPDEGAHALAICSPLASAPTRSDGRHHLDGFPGERLLLKQLRAEHVSGCIDHRRLVEAKVVLVVSPIRA